MHHPSPSAITYPSSPQPYYLPHSPTTSPCPTPDLTALLPTSLPYDQDTTYATQPYHPHLPYSTQPYYPPHCPTTHLTALRPAHDLLLPYSTQLYYPPHCLSTCTRPTPLLGYLSQIRLPYLCAHCTHIYYCDLTGYTYYPAHRTHVPHSTPPCPSPPQMYHATPISYRLYHIALPRTPLSSI